MGINKNTLEIEKKIMKKAGIKYKGINICELGNQLLTFQRKSGKDYYKSLCVENHVSIDLNKKNGSLPFDLNQPLPSSFLKRFDLITNYGTIEHVNNQYQAFKSVDEICKKGGIMIHLMPHRGSMEGHGRYYYTTQFMEELAKKCGYTVLDIKSYDDSLNSDIPSKVTEIVVLGVFLKQKDKDFITKDLFNTIKGMQDSGDLRNTGNYEMSLRWTMLKAWYLVSRIIMNPKRTYNKIKERIAQKN